MSREDAQAWYAQWQRAAPVMEKLRRERIRATVTSEAIDVLDDAFEAAHGERTRRTTSGLVAQQQLFARLRPCANS